MSIFTNNVFCQKFVSDAFRLIFTNMFVCACSLDVTLSCFVSQRYTFCSLPAAKETFKSFDKRGEDQIRVGDIAAAMKKLGHNIKPDWLESMEDEIDTEGESPDIWQIRKNEL